MNRYSTYHSRSIKTRTLLRAFVAFVTVSALGGCEKKNQLAGSETAAAVPDPAPVVAPAATAPAITELGFGALRSGMTFTEANDSLKGALKAAKGADLAECEYVQWEGGPKGLLVMVLENKIARVDVTDSSMIATDAGAKIGDSEDRIKALYGARVSVTPHKYEDGNYLRVKSADVTDTSHFIVFETAKGVVTRFRAGVLPGVDYVEGCS
ncbi:MAG: hypothetical protein ABI120_03960 [Gemmatimonadaceae bacterium]